MSILIDRDTTFIVQGITGREAVSLTRENLAYGSRIVGGVTPGRAGRDVYGVPVYDCVRDITKDQKVTCSIVCVPPNFTKDAVFEAIEARPHEIRLTCPFLRRVAMTRPVWRRRFNLGE